jgi:hypothetical protein
MKLTLVACRLTLAGWAAQLIRGRQSDTSSSNISTRGRGLMKAYLIITGTLFGLLDLMHLVTTVERLDHFRTDPWFVLGTAAITIVAAALSVWAWRLLRRIPA